MHKAWVYPPKCTRHESVLQSAQGMSLSPQVHKSVPLSAQGMSLSSQVHKAGVCPPKCTRHESVLPSAQGMSLSPQVHKAWVCAPKCTRHESVLQSPQGMSLSSQATRWYIRRNAGDRDIISTLTLLSTTATQCLDQPVQGRHRAMLSDHQRNIIPILGRCLKHDCSKGGSGYLIYTCTGCNDWGHGMWSSRGMLVLGRC